MVEEPDQRPMRYVKETIRRRPRTVKREQHLNCRETIFQFEDRPQPLSRGNHWIFDTKPEIFDNAYEARLMNNYTKCVKQINEKNAAYDRIQFENNVTNILKGFRDHQVYDSVDVVNNRFKHQLKRKARPLN